MRYVRHRSGISHLRQIRNSQSHTKAKNIDLKKQRTGFRFPEVGGVARKRKRETQDNIFKYSLNQK